MCLSNTAAVYIISTVCKGIVSLTYLPYKSHLRNSKDSERVVMVVVVVVVAAGVMVVVVIVVEEIDEPCKISEGAS